MEAFGIGFVGAEVRDIQARLAALGYDCGDDEPAVFGPGTRAAVRAFQQQRGLTADGLVGDDSWRSLVEAGRRLGDRLLHLTSPMLRGDDVRELQRRLNQLGFDTVYVDGVFGTETAEAVREFQRNLLGRIDGIVGPDVVATLRRLHREHQSAHATSVRERELLRRAPDRPSLAGARVLIDPAHGPADPGLVVDRLEEHALTWQIAQRLEGRLVVRGVQAILSRGPATTPTTSQRARLANVEDVNAIVSIHLNGLDSPEASGTAGYYFGHQSYVSEGGRRLAELAVDRLVVRTGAAHCRTHPATTTLLRESRAPAVVVEPGFLTHPDEGPRLADPGYQDAIADALTDAVAEFLTRPAAVGPSAVV